ncbi:MAG: response regulator [bacterium]
MTDLAVLIAGTSSSYLEISRKMLKFHYEQCDVDFAHSGKECIDKATSKEYELILFDYELGDQTGLEIIDELNERGVKSPLIMLIEEGDEIKAVQAIEKGAADYILKVRGYLTALPFTIRSILAEKNIALETESKNCFESAPEVISRTEGYFILDRKGRILSANLDIQKLTNFSEDELLELTIADLLPKDQEKSFFDWLNSVAANGHSGKALRTEIFNKEGERIALEIIFTAIKDEFQNVLSYRGRIAKKNGEISSRISSTLMIDQLEMVNQISQIVTTGYDEPLSIFLERIAESVCQIFRFRRSTLALLDKRKNFFIKQAMVGYSSFPVTDDRSIEVPQEVITRVFFDRFRVRVLYYNQDHRDTAHYLNSKYPERRRQKRRPPSQWHDRDLVLVNLMNRDGTTFGYISLDRPVPDHFPARDTFHNLELYGQLVSFAIENYYQFSTLEQRSRRMKQILVTSNIFKLHLSLNELLKEVVWSIRFSLNFNLVALGLISKRSGHLEMKAIACEDKVKRAQLAELNFPLKPLSQLMRAEYSYGKSYFVVKEEPVVKTFKHIYHGPKSDGTLNGHWPICGLLLVPIKSREGKIIGVLMADDPANNKLPGRDVVDTLEIMANQIAVAIDNRVLYVQAQQKQREGERKAERTDMLSGYVPTGVKRRFVDRFFK